METAVTAWQKIGARAEKSYAAIADVHGRADLFEAMLKHLDAQLALKTGIVLLGDLIDRGPESMRVLQRATIGVPGREFVSICGNHESMLLQCIDLEDPTAATGSLYFWLRNGGDVVADEIGYDPTNYGVRELRDALGTKIVSFLDGMQPHFRSGNVLFAHAGIHPGKPLAPQMARPAKDFVEVIEGAEEDSMRWVRGPWVGHDQPLDDGLFIIYGHTIQRTGRPLVTSCQAGIDLGAYKRGVLCAAEVDEDRMRFHFVGEYDAIQKALGHATMIA